MVTIAFPTAAAITNAVMALPEADRGRCLARQVEDGYEIDAPDDLESALRAEHPTAPLPVPNVSSAQALIQLSRTPGAEAGKSLLDDVMAALPAAGVEAEIWFHRSQTWQFENPYVVQIGAALGVTDAARADLFRQAALIKA